MIFSALMVMIITYLVSECPPDLLKWPIKSCYAQTFVLAFQILFLVNVTFTCMCNVYDMQGLQHTCVVEKCGGRKALVDVEVCSHIKM